MQVDLSAKTAVSFVRNASTTSLVPYVRMMHTFSTAYVTANVPQDITQELQIRHANPAHYKTVVPAHSRHAKDVLIDFTLLLMHPAK